MRKLTDKQRLFVLEYLKDRNATQAAIRAGYSEKYADRIGHQLLEKTRVQEEIQRRMEKMEEKIQEKTEYDLTKWREDAVWIKEFATEVEMDVDDDGNERRYLRDSKAAQKMMELLGRHLGAFQDKTTIDVNVQDALAQARKRTGK